MSRRRLTAFALPLALLSGASAALAAAPSPSDLQSAHLAGSFRMAGTVTDASGVRGERRGQHVVRAWAFVGPCTQLPCPTAPLLRARVNGLDGTILRRRSASLYSGTGTFSLAVSCGGRRYPTGLGVPYTISVRVTATQPSAQGVLVTAIRATYVSRSRTNRTPCVVAPAHDAVRYTGYLSVTG